MNKSDINYILRRLKELREISKELTEMFPKIDEAQELALDIEANCNLIEGKIKDSERRENERI